ncbi:hypothetical protein CH267_02095 [Rhodococcus sp. 06-621-2]|nr:phage minor capsid protein [Rhodococcus sp. 06-621-2]OZC62350.1 hypothetical protein CH267_02095 [Rhodococcus sp. 06-621-2]
MSLDPEKAESIPRKLIGMYSDTELSLLGMIADAVSKGIDDDDWYANQSAEALRFRNAAQRLAAGLSKAAPTVVGEAVGDAVAFGNAAVDEDIDLAGHLAAKSGRPAGLQANISIDDKATKLTRKAVADGVGTLATVNQALPGAASKLYQQVTARVNATSASSDLTRRQAVQQALDVLTARGITGFRDNAGRNWSLSTYVEMKSRTLVNNTLMQSHIDRMLDRGLDLVVVSSHKNPAPQCQPFEGQVLSIGDAPKGTTVRPNATGGDPVKVKIKATMDEARAQGFRHPNCRHSVAAFIPGASRTFTTEPNEEGYKATQQLRAMERAIRDTKRRQAVAIDPSVKKRLGATLRSQQTALKRHVEANDLKRRAQRERPDLGYRVNPPDAPTPASITPPPTGPSGDDLRAWLDAEKQHQAAEAARAATPKLQATFSSNVAAKSADRIQAELDVVPARSRELLEQANVRLFVGDSASDAARLDPAIANRYDGQTSADGRPLTAISFWDSAVRTVIITADLQHGSVSQVAHELGHALDMTALRATNALVEWQEQGSENLPASVKSVAQQPRTKMIRNVSDDPYLKWAHDTFVLNSPIVDDYYRTGSHGHAQSGREEWIAEGYAAIVTGKTWKLNVICGRNKEAADILRWTFRRLGVM